MQFTNPLYEKVLNFVYVGVRNKEGRHRAIEPEILITEKKWTGKRQWTDWKVLKYRDTLTGFDLIEAISSRPKEEELAYLILTEVLKPVSEIDGGSGEYFVLGFSFKDGENFYIGTDHLLPIKIGETFSRTLLIKARGITGQHTRITTHVKSWNEITIVSGKDSA